MTWRTKSCLLGTLVLIATNGLGPTPYAAAAKAKSRATDLGTFTTFSVPGATNTTPLGINADGVIVGRYLGAGRVHGFVRSESGEITTVDVPDASLTATSSINNRGDITGFYRLLSAPTVPHGLLLKDGAFTTFDPPGSTFTNPLGINEHGDIVGRYCTLAVCAGAFRGFLFSDGAFTSIDVPGALETDAFAITDSGQIAGGFMDAGHHAQVFLLSNGTLTTFAPPGGQAVSLDKGGINERGEIVGLYCDSALPCAVAPGAHGFLINADGFTSIDVPGALATYAFGINASGDVVGGYLTAQGARGFLLSRSTN